MVKKLSALILVLFSSVLILFGCGDPYDKFKLTVSTSDVVLYLNEQTTEPDGEGETSTESTNQTTYSSETTFTVKVDGTTKEIGGGVEITQYAINGVDDVVKIDTISNDTTADGGAKYRLTALKPGKGVIIINTVEGNKKHEINVTVYVPVKSVEFKDSPIAIRYGGSINISNNVIHKPQSTNQKEMKFYLEDYSSSNVVKDETGGVISTNYASIENGVVTSKDVLGYPVDNKGNRCIKVYGVSIYDPSIKTPTLSIPVLEIVDEKDFVLQTVTEAGYAYLTKNNYGYYDIILGHNVPTNPYIYARSLTLKLSNSYLVDKQYAITTNYNSVLTQNSVFQLDSSVEEKDRYNYEGIVEKYPYKTFNFSQVNLGTQILEVYVDRLGYEGLFTTTLKIRVIVKDFAQTLTATDSAGKDATAGLVVYNAYGGSSLGTSVALNLSPNEDGNYKIKVTLVDCPLLDGVVGVTMTLANSTNVYNGDEVPSGTKLYLKHFYDYEFIQQQIIEAGFSPKLVVTHTYSTAPTSNTEEYKEYSISQIIPLDLRPGVTDLRIPSSNSEIKINAVTGRAIMDGVAVTGSNNENFKYGIYADGEEEKEEEIPEIVLATIDDQPADLYELIDSIKTLSVNSMASDLNPLDNKFFGIVFKEGPHSGKMNRLVLEPKLQSEQARIAIEVKTNNNITKTIIIEVFVPIVYSEMNAEQVNLEIYNEAEVSSDIYEIEKTNFKILLKSELEIVDDFYIPGEEEALEVKDTITYTTLNSLTLATNSEIGLNVFNYIVLKNLSGEDKINKVLYNSNVTISQNREYYTITNKKIDGVTIPFLATKKLKTNGQLSVDIKVSGYDSSGKTVELTKSIYLTIIEPITSVSLYPKNTTLYVANSLGALKEEESKAKLSLNVSPANASSAAGVAITYSYDNNVLYSLVSDVYYVDQFGNNLTLDGSGEFVGLSTSDLTFNGTNPEVKLENVIYKDLSGYFYYFEGERFDFEKNTQRDFNIKVEHLITLDPETGAIQAKINSQAINSILNEYKNETGATVDTSQVINSIFANNVVITVYGSLKQYTKPTISDSTTITLRYAQKVEKIIPSSSATGLYFDTRDLTADYEGQKIIFNVLPTTAKNKTLIVTIDNDGVAQIVGGVDKNNRVTGNYIIVKPRLSGGRTFIRVAAEDSYEIDSKTGIPVPSSYIDISVRVANGTKQYPFEISTPEEFMEIGEDIAEGNNTYYYALRESFSMVATPFNPFAEFNGGLTGKFTYEIDGVDYSQQNTIFDLTADVNSNLDSNLDYNYGLFAVLGEQAEIENLILENVNFKFNLNNETFAKAINIGAIAGVNKGKIYDSSVYGQINVTSNVTNVNVGGLAGITQSYFEVDNYSEETEPNQTFVAGSISATENNTTFANNTETANVTINYVGSSQVANPNINLGGVTGYVQTYSKLVNKTNALMMGTPFTADTMYKGVSPYQYFTDYQTISNLVVSANIVGVDENSKPLKANIGGVAGFASSTLINNVTVLPQLYGHSNIGGVVGYAEHTSILNSKVEFANTGVTGAATIAIAGYTNVGGVVGYANNTNIALSYVRAYYNNMPVDNLTYFGNMTLLESDLAVKNIGGLIGVVFAEGISNQLYEAGSNADFMAYGISNYVSSTSSNAIIKSYFNADINTTTQSLSGVVNAGGLVGKVETQTKSQIEDGSAEVNPLDITNSYVYGSIKQSETKTFTIQNKVYPKDESGNDIKTKVGNVVADDVVEYAKTGTETIYVVGTLTLNESNVNNEYVGIDPLSLVTINDIPDSFDDVEHSSGMYFIEITINHSSETSTIVESPNTYNCFIQYITYKVHELPQKFIGSDLLYLKQTKIVGAPQDKPIDESDPDSKTITTTETNFTYEVFTNSGENINIITSYFAINGVDGYVVEGTAGANDVFANKNLIYTISNVQTEVKNNLSGNIAITEVLTNSYLNAKSKTNLSGAGFAIIELSETNKIQGVHTNIWAIVAELNSGYPVLFDPNNFESILFKVLPTEIKINVIDLTGFFTNASFVKDGDNLVLFYNEHQDGRKNVNINRYKLVTSDDVVDTVGVNYPLNVIQVDLDLVDLTKYGINAQVDKSMIVTSSNENILAIENSDILVTKSTGIVNLTISSKLDTSIKDEIKILVVNGVSDVNIYKSKNVTTSDNALVPIKQNNVYVDEVEEEPEVVAPDPGADPGVTPDPDATPEPEVNVFVDELTDNYSTGAINQVIDKASNYFVASINEDGLNIKDSNGTYTKNADLGIKVEVSDVGAGLATLNGKTLQKGVTYLFTSLDEFVLSGVEKGLLYLTITPFIMAPNGFGTTLTQTATESLSVNNCVLLENLQKVYKFNVIPKAERPEIDRTTATLDPTGSVNLTISTITSDFNVAGGNITVNEVIRVKIIDNAENRTVANLPLDMSGDGTNSSLINIELQDTIVNTTDDVLKIELIKKIVLSFNTEMYKDRTSGVTFNLNNLNYRFEFYAASNTTEPGTFDLTVVPKKVTEIKAAYYPNSEVRMDGEFFPQEASSDYIVPSRVGMLKIELSPDYNNAEYVEVTVDDKMKQYVTFVQKVAVMATDENSYITGYEETNAQPTSLNNFKGIKLVNESSIVNGSKIYYTGRFYLQVILSEKAPVNEQITFTVTAYKTVNRQAVSVTENPQELTLTVQPLPDILLTVDGKSEGYIAKGSVAELEIETINFDGDVELTVITDNGDVTNVTKIYDAETDKHYISVGVGATAGDTVIITATVSQYLNGVLETDKSEVRLFVVEYLIKGVRVEGTTYVNGKYQFETLNGTTNLLNVVFDTEKHKDNEAVSALKTNLEQEASGRLIPDGSGGFINNWWRLIGNNTYETLYPNTTYENYQFADLVMSDLNSSHFYAIKTLAVSKTDVISYKMQYYYNDLGIPKLYTGIDYGYQIFDLSFDFILYIKDNSTYDHPNPITNEADFMALGGLNLDGSDRGTDPVTDGHYILIKDLVFDEYFPFEANFFSLDGNGYTITIKNFNTEKYKETTTKLNIGLFEKVSENTVLKNVTIDVSKMLVSTGEANQILTGIQDPGSAAIDLTGVKDFNFGLIAGENNGSITNAKVINTQNTNMINKDSKKNLLVSSTTGYIDGKLVEANIGGLVGVNKGTISNSYVGLNSSNYVNSQTATTSTELHSNESSGSTAVTTYPFNIVAGKSVAGLVNTNSSIVANSYVFGTGVINTATIFSGAKTAGFVVTNTETGNIFNAMVEGLATQNYRASKTHVYLEGKGFIGGFVYSNSGKISNAYSNIYITTNSGGSGGFVYTNEQSGVITNAYSTVENAVNSWAHGQFTGIDDEDNYNNFGTYNSCYYLSFESEVENMSEPATSLRGRTVNEGSEEEKASDNQFRDSGSFNGFNFASGNDTNNIWQISETSLHYGPRLISISNATTFSHRVLAHTSTDANTQQTVYDYEYDTTNYYGSDTNPLLVNSATEFITFIINNSKTMTFTYKDEHGNVTGQETLNVFGVSTKSQLATNMPHSVRLINDLDFSQIQLNNFIVDGKRINDISFVGRLDGNGMKMTGIRLVDQNQSTIHENFGLFNQVGLTEKQMADENLGAESVVETAIMNVSIYVSGVDSSQAVKVGTIAGSMYDTSLINVIINAENNAFVRGPNLVGGIAGLIINTKERLIADITTNGISITSSHSSVKGSVSTATKVNTFGNPYNGSIDDPKELVYSSYYNNKENSIDNLKRYSYAGSVAGVIDAVNRREEDTANNIKTEIEDGETTVIAQVDGKNKSVVLNVPVEVDGTTKYYDITIDGSYFREVGTSSWVLTSSSSTLKDKIKSQSGDVEGIKNSHRSKPINNFVSKVTVQGGGYISGEHVGGLFGYIGETTHLKNSKYLIGQKPVVKDENSDTEAAPAEFVQQLVGFNYAGGIVGENYGMLEQVVVEHIEDFQPAIDDSFNTTKVVQGEINDLFGASTAIAIGGIAGFSAGSVISDSYAKVDVVNANAKIAGGVVGLMAGRNYVGHVYTTGNVLGANYVGGLIGLYNQLYIQLRTEVTYNDIKPDDPGWDASMAGKKIETTTIVQPKLLLDYAFALNQWGTETQDLLYTNLKTYYDNTNSDLVLRMPEVGNQLMQVWNNNTTTPALVNETGLKYSTTFVGSLIGGINASDTKQITLKTGANTTANEDISNYTGSTGVEKEAVVKDEEGRIVGNFNSATPVAGEEYVQQHISTNKINNAVEKSRIITVIKGKSAANSTNFYFLSTVISSTFNSAKLIKNDIKLSGLGYNLDENYTSSVPLSDIEKLKKDKLEFTSCIGNQLKLSTIIGSTGDNESLLTMFRWDTIAMATSDFSQAGSQVWKLEKRFPEYITGIYSNFIEITNEQDFRDKLVYAVSTKNQYFLLRAPETADIGTNAGQNTARPNILNASFEGTIIGVNNSAGQKPNLVFNVSSENTKLTTLFRELSTATIMNVDFTINVTTGSDNNVPLTNEDGSSTQNIYNGLFAKTIESSVLNNCDFTINIRNGMEFETIGSDMYQGFGLAIGCLRESSLQNCNFTLNVVGGTGGGIAHIKLKTATSKVSVGGFVGESVRGELQNVSVISKNNSQIKVTTNATTTNLGSVVGLATNTKILSVNETENKDILADDDAKNDLFNVESVKVGSTLNYGGLFGNVSTTDITSAYFKGSINYNQSNNVNLNFGGAVGYAENSSIQHVNVNDYLEYETYEQVDGDKTVIVTEFKRTQVSTPQEFNITNNYVHDDTAKKALTTNVGGVMGYGVNSKLRGNTENELAVSNITKIVVNVASSNTTSSKINDIVNVGGVAGFAKNNGNNVDISKAYNAGKIQVFVNTSNASDPVVEKYNKNISTFVGGIVGTATGGKYAYLYSLADVSVKAIYRYAIGGIFGRSVTNTTQKELNLTRFVSFGDIYVEDTKPSKPKSGYDNSFFVGGVAGLIEGSASQYDNGYTLAKVFYGTDKVQLGVSNQDNGAINGIAYISSISNNTFSNVYFVYDFLPYSNFTNEKAQSNGAKVIVKQSDVLAARNATSETESEVDKKLKPMIYGGIEYSALNATLNAAMNVSFYGANSTSVEFAGYTSTTNGNEETRRYYTNLPTLFADDYANKVEMPNISEIIGAYDLVKNNKVESSGHNISGSGSLLNAGSKLNPHIIESNASQNVIQIDNTQHYILTKSVDGKTLEFVNGTAQEFRGVLTGLSRADYITVQLGAIQSGANADKIVNNFGFISNLVVHFKNTASEPFKGMFIQNNYGNISNCLVYGYITGEVTYADDVSTFVYNNNGNIVQSGSAVMYVVTKMTLSNGTNNRFSGFVFNNNGDGFIKDCYSFTSIVNSTTIPGAILQNQGAVTGFVNTNAGVIETSYYAGSLKDVENISNAFAADTSAGTLRNCYYDGEATSVKTNAERGSVVAEKLNKDKAKAQYLPTDEILKVATSTENASIVEKAFFKNSLKTKYVPSLWNYVYDSTDKAYMFGYSGLSDGIKLPTLFKLRDDTQVVDSFVTLDDKTNTTIFGIYHAGQVNNMGQLQQNDSTNSINLALLTNIDMSIINYGDSDQGIYSSISDLTVQFHGLNHTISNLTIKNNASLELGLFTKIDSGIALVKNLTMLNPTIEGNTNSKAGTIAGSLVDGDIINVNINNTKTNATNINNNNLTGGVVGEMYSGLIQSVVVDGLGIKGVKDVGGIVGAIRNGTIKGSTVKNGSVSAETSVGGVIGLAQAQTNVTADIRIINVNAQDLTVEGTANISKEFDAIKNKTFDWKTNYSNASTLAMLYGGTNSSTNTGGIIGWLGTGTITDPTLNNVTISAISAIGGVAGRVDKNTEIVMNSPISPAKANLTVNGSFVVGGVVGYNEGKITGNNTSSPVYATVAINQGSGSRYNAAVGGVVGTNNGGTITKVVVGASDIYGSRLFGGIAGLTTGSTARIENCSVATGVAIHYNSELDMDQHVGDMPNLKMGIDSKNTTYAQNDFDTYFGLCGGDYSGKIFNADKTTGRNIIEYGGVDPKVTSNKIAGKYEFYLLFGFIAGAKFNSSVISGCSVAPDVVIDGIYDSYKLYIANVTNYKSSGSPNKSWITRSIVPGRREFEILGSTNQFAEGQVSYKKYTDSLNTNVNSSYGLLLKQKNDTSYGNWDYSLNKHACTALDEGEDLFLHLEAYDATVDWDYLTEWWGYGYNITKHVLKNVKNSVYPGMTWVESGCSYGSTQDLGSKEYAGPDKWFTAISSTYWQNINFHTG